MCGTAAALGTVGCVGEEHAVSVLSAGSLARTVEDYVAEAFREATGIDVRGEYYGTNALLRMVTEGVKHPDVVVSADAALLRERLFPSHADWAVTFATNALGFAYREGSEIARRLAAGEHWYEIARELDTGDLIIGDPDLDPLGYRALQAFALAEQTHGLDEFRSEMRGIVRVEPDEPRLMTRVESGAAAAAIVYRNMAETHGCAFRAFPKEYNFADPSMAEYYGTARVTVGEEDDTVRGRPIRYNATVLDAAGNAGNGRRFVQFLADARALLLESGLTIAPTQPNGTGDIPGGISV